MSRRRANSLTKNSENHTQNPSLRRSQSQTFFDPSNPPQPHEEPTVDLDDVFADLSEGLLLQAAKDYKTYKTNHFHALCQNLKGLINGYENAEEKIPQLLDCLHAYAMAHIRGEHNDLDVLPTGVFSYIPQLLDLLPADARADWIHRIHAGAEVCMKHLEACPYELLTEDNINLLKAPFKSAEVYFKTIGYFEIENEWRENQHGYEPLTEKDDPNAFCARLEALYAVAKNLNTFFRYFEANQNKSGSKESTKTFFEKIDRFAGDEEPLSQKAARVAKAFIQYHKKATTNTERALGGWGWKKNAIGDAIKTIRPLIPGLLSPSAIAALEHLEQEPNSDESVSTSGEGTRSALVELMNEWINSAHTVDELTNLAQFFNSITHKLNKDDLDNIRVAFCEKIDLKNAIAAGVLEFLETYAPVYRALDNSPDQTTLLPKLAIESIHAAFANTELCMDFTYLCKVLGLINTLTPESIWDIPLEITVPAEVEGTAVYKPNLFNAVFNPETIRNEPFSNPDNSITLTLREYLISQLIRKANIFTAGDFPKQATIDGFVITTPTRRINLIKSLVVGLLRTRHVGSYGGRPETTYNAETKKLLRDIACLFSKESPEYMAALFDQDTYDLDKTSPAEMQFYRDHYWTDYDTWTLSNEHGDSVDFVLPDNLLTTGPKGETALHYLATAPKHPEYVLTTESGRDKIPPHNGKFMAILIKKEPRLKVEGVFTYAVKALLNNPAHVYAGNVFEAMEQCVDGAEPEQLFNQIFEHINEGNVALASQAIMCAANEYFERYCKKVDDCQEAAEALLERVNALIDNKNATTTIINDGIAKEIRAGIAAAFFHFAAKHYKTKTFGFAQKQCTHDTRMFIQTTFDEHWQSEGCTGLDMLERLMQPNIEPHGLDRYGNMQQDENNPICRYVLDLIQHEQEPGTFFMTIAENPFIKTAFECLGEDALCAYINTLSKKEAASDAAGPSDGAATEAPNEPVLLITKIPEDLDPRSNRKALAARFIRLKLHIDQLPEPENEAYQEKLQTLKDTLNANHAEFSDAAALAGLGVMPAPRGHDSAGRTITANFNGNPRGCLGTGGDL